MNHLFEKINKQFNHFAKLDKKTISEANNLKKELFLIFKKYQNLDYSRIELESKKRLICYDLFGKIPYNYRILTIEFLMWHSCNNEEIKENIIFWQMQYESFINCFKREPNSFFDLKRWENLSVEKQTEYELNNF